MKKILFGLLCLVLCSCNYQYLEFNYSYKKAHLYENNKCYEISSWRDYEDGEQIQLDIKDYGIILTSAYNCLLIADKCPICDM